MSEFVGFKEKWVERGWTRKQMRERIEELGLTVNSWCVLQPYELNFMQNPNANQEIEEDVESGERAIAQKNLWKPGETITVSLDKTTSDYAKTIKKYVMQDVQPYISMKLKFVDSSDGKLLVRVIPPKNALGTFVGKQSSGQQPVSLSSTFFKKGGDLFISDLNYNAPKLNMTRYIIAHEFGHALGLEHEFDRQLCKQAGVTCTDADPLSVMNYPISEPQGVKGLMDHFSPNDIKWLKKVYS